MKSALSLALRTARSLQRHPRPVLATTTTSRSSSPVSSFSTKTKQKSSNTTTTTNNNNNNPSWTAQKKAAKELRRERYKSRQDRQQRLQTRREAATHGEKRAAFRAWFLPHHKVHNEYHVRKARQAGLDWKVHVAVILERKNVVLPDKEDWEVEYEQLEGYLMQFGKDYPKALQPAQEILPMEEAVASDEELYEFIKSKGFEPAPRVTEEDLNGNVRTTNRKLKTNVFLTVQDDSSNNKWHLPTVPLQQGETFLDAAKRAIPELLGEQVEFWCPSNCPCAVNIHPFDEPQDGYYGVKTFFMKVQYDEGDVEEAKIADFAWLDRTEMEERFQEQDGDNASKFYKYLL